jgi:DNA mismatch repair ATPase MutS
VLHAETASAELKSLLQALPSAAPGRRIAALPAPDFLLSHIPAGSSYAWVDREPESVRCAVFALHRHLASLQLEAALQDPQLDPSELSVNGDGGRGPVAVVEAGPTTAPAGYFDLDVVTAKDLEIFHCNTTASAGVRTLSNLWSTFSSDSSARRAKADQAATYTLFDTLNYCKTPFGRRKLQHWVVQPLCSLDGIVERQAAVRWLAEASERMSRYNTTNAATWAFNLSAALAACVDLESMLTALQHGRINPRRLLRLFRAVDVVLPINPNHTCYTNAFDDIPPLISRTLRDVPFAELKRLVETCSFKIVVDKAEQDAVVDIFQPKAESEFVRLSELRGALLETEEQLQAELVRIRVILRQPTLAYRTLRTGPMSAIEHLIEVPAGSAQRIPADWIKTNCTKQVDRYHTPAVLALQDRLYQLRDELKFASRDAWLVYVQQVKTALHGPLRRTVAALGSLEALLSLSRLCKMPGFVEPTYTAKNTNELAIVAGRHPMVERSLEARGGQFIPNDITLRSSFQAGSCQVVTGPNMGGKSSYVRTVALICLLGQLGAHVPAESATLCILDRIFTRMGAGDDLAAGHSTFMSELYRTNYILQRATQRSLVILDELGRGTATNDGLAIAQATLGYALRRLGCALLFVTHFPQIADLVEAADAGREAAGENGDSTIPAHRAVNVHMGYVQEGGTADGGVVFLYKAVSEDVAVCLHCAAQGCLRCSFRLVCAVVLVSY